MKKIKLGNYKEYTGKFIQVVNLAKNPDTSEEFVIFQHLSMQKEKMIAMPVEKFFEKAPDSDIEKYTLVE